MDATFRTSFRPTIRALSSRSLGKFTGKNSGVSPDNFAALGYDAAKVVLDAIKRADSTNSTAIRDAIAQTKDFTGVSGKITIDAQRNASKPAVILAIKDQHVQYFEKINPN